MKKYSYFYLSRKLWYIPLYFTVWFSFYVTYLILQSIGRHKVDLPNHVISRRSLQHPTVGHREATERIDRLAAFVMEQIAGYEETDKSK